MNRLQGEVSVHGLSQGFALATQESWIQNATVRDNILFHQPYDVARYEAVVWACALTEDLKVWTQFWQAKHTNWKKGEKKRGKNVELVKIHIQRV